MYQITAAEFMPLPIMEMRLAMKISRIPRCRNISLMLFNCNPAAARHSANPP
jgi:hypothetical protein